MIGAGTVVEGRYRVERALGTGAAAQVLRAHDTQLGRPVALKLLDARGPLADADRLAAEAQALAAVRHANVLAVLDHGFFEGRPYLVLELAEGGTLLDRLKAGAIPADQVVVWAKQILDALEATHAADVLHRDLKPENVLLTADGQVRLSDYGLAKHSSSGIRTASGLILGTPEFMAPEIMVGEPATPASDVYSWGCLVYTLATRRTPHRADLMEMLRLRQRETLDTSELPPEVDLAVRAALRAAPEKRATIDELRQILAGEVPAWALTSSAETVAVSGEQVASALPPRRAGLPPGGFATSASRAAAVSGGERPRTGRLGLAIAAVGMVSVVGVVGAWWLSRGAPPPPSAAPAPTGDQAQAAELLEARSVAGRIGEALRQDLDVEEVLSAAQEAAFPHGMGELQLVGGTHAQEMERFRNDEQTYHADPSALEPVRRAVPHRLEVRREAGALEDFLTAPSVSLEEKLPLLASLQDAARVDAYFEAWDMIPPYDARRLYQMGIGLETIKPEVVPRPRDELRSDSLARRTPYLLFERPEEEQKYPWLMSYRGGASTLDGAALTSVQGLRHKKLSWSDLNQLVLEFVTPGGETPRFREARLLFALSNMAAPSEFSIHLNGRDFIYPAEVSEATSATWEHAKGAEFILSLRLPARFFVHPLNRLELRYDTPPGVRSWGGIGLYWVGILLEE